jgi:UDP-N-acetylglucosamine--N-acetylmuramyl-(pentapeptide) pyrophosphoryl-undecaprenol N-acetylglucosamine transferase
VVFSEAAKLLKNRNVIKVHMPVRREIEALRPRASTTDEFHLLVFGGSQGSRALNNALLECVLKGGPWLKNIRIVHQTGSADYKRLLQDYAAAPDARDFLEVHEYLHDMPARLDWADLVVARAGTGTISELAAAGKPAILVPLPTAADDHQTRNAEELVKMNAAVLLAQKDLTPERLIREIEALKNHREGLLELSHNIQQFHSGQAAIEIANIVLGANR